MRFPDDLCSPSFLQFQTALLIQNTNQLYLLYYNNLTIKLLTPTDAPESIEGALMQNNSISNILIFLKGRYYTYSSEEFTFHQHAIKNPGPDNNFEYQQGLMASHNEIFATLGSKIVIYNINTNKTKTLYTSALTTFNDCHLVTAGPYFLISGHDGRFLVFKT